MRALHGVEIEESCNPDASTEFEYSHHVLHRAEHVAAQRAHPNPRFFRCIFRGAHFASSFAGGADLPPLATQHRERPTPEL
jgi:coproporphyrinogen III oxidase